MRGVGGVTFFYFNSVVQASLVNLFSKNVFDRASKKIEKVESKHLKNMYQTDHNKDI
jgi:hypothetical protein